MDVLDWLAAAGGVCTTASAREHVSARGLRRLRDRGALRVPLRGWVALDGTRNEVTAALEHGGVLTCASMFRATGLWVPHGDTALHVRVHRSTNSDRRARAANAKGVRLHALRRGVPEARPWNGIDRPTEALAAAADCVAPADLLAAADGALRTGLLDRASLELLADRLPAATGRLLRTATSRSGSGSESRFALLLRSHGIAFVQQPELLPGEFFDFQIGRSLVIEIDSLEWHGNRTQMANDRRRDAMLTALGYRVVRFTYEQVLFDPEYVMAIVLGLVRRNVHERAPFPTAA